MRCCCTTDGLQSMDMHLWLLSMRTMFGGMLRISQVERVQLQGHNLWFRPSGLHTTAWDLRVLCAVQTREGFQGRHRFSCRWKILYVKPGPWLYLTVWSEDAACDCGQLDSFEGWQVHCFNFAADVVWALQSFRCEFCPWDFAWHHWRDWILGGVDSLPQISTECPAEGNDASYRGWKHWRGTFFLGAYMDQQQKGMQPPYIRLVDGALLPAPLMGDKVEWLKGPLSPGEVTNILKGFLQCSDHNLTSHSLEGHDIELGC